MPKGVYKHTTELGYKIWEARRKNGTDRCSKKTISKMSFAQTGKTRSEKTREKVRKGVLKSIKEIGHSRIGRNETLILNKQEKIDNCIIDRQFYVHKAGKTVDGYCHETNTVYEVYEFRHLRKGKPEKDLRRQKEIEKVLKCKFIIIWDPKKRKVNGKTIKDQICIGDNTSDKREHKKEKNKDAS